MPPGAPDNISYLPTSLMNHWALIKLTMPLSFPAADAKGGLCICTLCCTTLENRQSVCMILIAFFIDYSSPIYKKTLAAAVCRLNFSKFIWMSLWRLEFDQKWKDTPISVDFACDSKLQVLVWIYQRLLSRLTILDQHFHREISIIVQKDIPVLSSTIEPLDQNATRLQGNWHFEQTHPSVHRVVGLWAIYIYIYISAHKPLWDWRQQAHTTCWKAFWEIEKWSGSRWGTVRGKGGRETHFITHYLGNALHKLMIHNSVRGWETGFSL